MANKKQRDRFRKLNSEVWFDDNDQLISKKIVSNSHVEALTPKLIMKTLAAIVDWVLEQTTKDFPTVAPVVAGLLLDYLVKLNPDFHKALSVYNK